LIEVIGTSVESVEAVQDGEPGTFFINVSNPDKISMVLQCPCGCKDVSQISLHQQSNNTKGWYWDGIIRKPTLSPSLHKQTERSDGKLIDHWHGWLKQGIWRE